MISTVTKEINGEPMRFKLSADAQMGLEDIYDKGTVKIAQEFFERLESEDIQTREVVQFLTFIGEDGLGVERSKAAKIYSDLGLLGCISLIADCFNKAFPELEEASKQMQNDKDEKGKPAKNSKRAPQRK